MLKNYADQYVKSVRESKYSAIHELVMTEAAAIKAAGLNASTVFVGDEQWAVMKEFASEYSAMRIPPMVEEPNRFCGLEIVRVRRENYLGVV